MLVKNPLLDSAFEQDVLLPMVCAASNAGRISTPDSSLAFDSSDLDLWFLIRLPPRTPRPTVTGPRPVRHLRPRPRNRPLPVGCPRALPTMHHRPYMTAGTAIPWTLQKTVPTSTTERRILLESRGPASFPPRRVKAGTSPTPIHRRMLRSTQRPRTACREPCSHKPCPVAQRSIIPASSLTGN